jgi:metal-responsive CopG/Arc/MetJ family transcriptional regulator
MATKKLTVAISISLPYSTICEIDEIVEKEGFSSRSSYILELIKKDLEQKKNK